MNNLIEFYKNLLQTLDLIIDENGTIMVEMGGTKTPILIDGLPLVLPTDENIKTSVSMETGKPEKVKYLFNPLDESAIKGENKSFLKFRDIMELKMLGVIYQIGEVLYGLLGDKNINIDDMTISKFVVKLNSFKARGVTQIIDEKTLSHWVTMYETIMTKDLSKTYLKLYVKRGGKIDNIKYNRVGVITFPFLEALNEYDVKSDGFLGAKLRNKDKHAFESLFTFMFGNKEELINGIKIGSLNKLSPSTHTLCLMYDFIYNSLKDIIVTIQNMEVEDEIKLNVRLNPLDIPVNNLGDFIDSLEQEVKRIPNDDKIVNEQPMQQQVSPVVTTTQQQSKAGTNKSSGGSFWDKFGAERNTAPAVALQQPVMQQPMMQQPIAQQPMMQQPIAQQPMMQQPIAQQPMMQQSLNVANAMPNNNQFQQQPMMQQRPMVMGGDPWSQGQQQMPMGQPIVTNVATNRPPW